MRERSEHDMTPRDETTNLLGSPVVLRGGRRLLERRSRISCQQRGTLRPVSPEVSD